MVEGRKLCTILISITLTIHDDDDDDCDNDNLYNNIKIER